jgi:phosphoglucomutase
VRRGASHTASPVHRTSLTRAPSPSSLHNFVQSIFDVLPAAEVAGATLVVSGDGRFWTREAIQIIIKIAAANGVGRVWVGQGGLLSTPAVSCVIREREGGVAYGGIILTASHNPGGLEEDFGIKYNTANGGPAPEAVTDAIFAATGAVAAVRTCAALPDVDLDVVGVTRFAESDAPGARAFIVEVIDCVADYAAALERAFDFPALRAFVARPDFSMAYDGMSGVAGPYGHGILKDRLGVPAAALHNCTPLADFGGHHPDPNLTYAAELVCVRTATAAAARAARRALTPRLPRISPPAAARWACARTAPSIRRTRRPYPRWARRRTATRTAT